MCNALVAFISTGWPLPKDQGNKTLWSTLGSLPHILQANCMSRERLITRFVWIVHRLVSSNRPTRYASAASCRAPMVIPWNCMSNLKPWAISWTNLWKGSLWMRSLVIFWNLQIFMSTTVSGLNWHGCRVASVLDHACLHMRVIFALTWPCLALLIPSILSSWLRPTALGLPMTLVGPLPGKCLGVLPRPSLWVGAQHHS